MYNDKRQLLLSAQKSALVSALMFKKNIDTQLDQLASGKMEFDDVRPLLTNMINETLWSGLVALKDMRSSDAPLQDVARFAQGVSNVTLAVHSFASACEETLSNHRDSSIYESLCQHLEALKADNQELNKSLDKAGVMERPESRNDDYTLGLQ